MALLGSVILGVGWGWPIVGTIVRTMGISWRRCSSEVLVSGTLKDVVDGAGITLTPRGMNALKGIHGNW